MNVTLVGASWYVLNTAANALPTDGRWLIAQITTTGSISGTINYQIFPLGVVTDEIQKSVDFDGEGDFPQSVTVTVCGCMDQTACNYNPEANNEDGSCLASLTSVACVEVKALPLANATATATCLTSASFAEGTEVFGCTDSTACNYNPRSNNYDGSCLVLGRRVRRYAEHCAGTATMQRCI